MPNLQVKGIDENLYSALKARAKLKRRSISQEVIRIIEYHLSQPDETLIDNTAQFLSLSWSGQEAESAETMITNIQKNRKSGNRFSTEQNVFD